LKTELAEAEKERDQLSGRIGTLEELTDTGSEVKLSPVKTSSEEIAVLRGADIRTTAVRVLAGAGHIDSPIHYREWLSLLEEQGFAITGKRPDAVFLNQIVRSPVVKATTAAGVYEIDWAAEERLSRHLDQLKAELRKAIADDSLDASGMEKLTLECRRLERSLSEAKEALLVRRAVAA
jgi:hypothetical protein